MGNMLLLGPVKNTLEKKVRWMISDQEQLQHHENNDNTTRAKFLPEEYRTEGNCKVIMASSLQISNYSSSSVITCSAANEKFNQTLTLQLLGKYYREL